MTKEKLLLLKSLHTLLTTTFKGSSFGTLQMDQMTSALNDVINDHEVHPLTIPGILLAEAIKYGKPTVEQNEDGRWTAYIMRIGIVPLKTCDTAIEALDYVIAHAKEIESWKK